MANLLSVASIAIPKPNIPLRDLNERADFRVSNFTIWKSTLPSDVTPASIGIDSTEQTTLDVTIQGPIPPGQTFTLTGEFLGEFLGKSVNKSILTIEAAEFDSSKATVSVTVKGCLVNVPWGIQDTIEWRVDGETPTKTPIELYAITPHEYIPAYFKHEIPVEFLQIFILPILGLGINTHEKFLEYTAVVCHKSDLDQDAKNNYTNYPPVHSYIYNHTGGGAWSFIGETGGAFMLNKWLKNRFDSPHRSIHSLNCFDQAGLVTLVLALGLPTSSATLRWYDMHPYGYIDGDLIGVGRCNNPYFGEGEQNDKTQAGANAFMDDPTDPRRSGFTRHVFPSIITEGRERVLDACAGPHIGTETLEEYIAAAIKTDKIPAKWDKEDLVEPYTRTIYCPTGSAGDAEWKYRKSKDPYGVNSLNSSRITPRSYLDLSETQRSFVDTLADKSKVPGVKSDNRMKEVNLGPLIDNLTAKLQESGRKFAEPIKNIQETNTHVEWSWVISADEAITVEMIVGKLYSDAFDAMNKYLLSYTKPEVPLSMEGPDTKDIEANHYLAGPDVAMWVDSNIFVRVSRSSRYGKRSHLLQEITDDIHSLMSEAANGPNGQNSGGVSMEPVGPPENPVVGSEFTITVKVSNGSEVEAIIVPKDGESDTNPRVLVIDRKVKPVNNSASFRFLALSEGTLAIEFLCAHFETLEVSTTTCEVTIKL